MSGGAGDDDLNANSFFQAFQNMPLFESAAKNKYVVVVPVEASLKAATLNKEFMHSHILKQSPYFKNEMISLDNKVVAIRENVLICKKGFPRHRRVLLLCEELYYDEDFESFRVLRVNFPLLGKVPRAYMEAVQVSQKVSGKPLELRKPSDHHGIMLQLFDSTAATDHVHSSINRFVGEFNKTYMLVKSLISNTGEKIKRDCQRILDSAIEKARGEKERPAGWPAGSAREDLLGAIECLMLEGLHEKIFNGLRELYAQEDRQCSERIRGLLGTTMESLGIRDELQCNVGLAVQQLMLLQEAKTPIEKLACLQESARQLAVAVDTRKLQQSSSEVADVKADLVLSADDMLPMTIFCIIQCHRNHSPALTPQPSGPLEPRSPAPLLNMRLHANTEFIKHFMPSNAPHLSAHLANMQGALQFITSGTLSASPASGRKISFGASSPHLNSSHLDSVLYSDDDLDDFDISLAGGGGSMPFDTRDLARELRGVGMSTSSRNAARHAHPSSRASLKKRNPPKFGANSNNSHNNSRSASQPNSLRQPRGGHTDASSRPRPPLPAGGVARDALLGDRRAKRPSFRSSVAASSSAASFSSPIPPRAVARVAAPVRVDPESDNDEESIGDFLSQLRKAGDDVVSGNLNQFRKPSHDSKREVDPWG